VSEYQRYEFLAIDRKLTPADQAELRKITSRATITASRLFNEYQWGDFKGDPRALVERFFDIFAYWANWGTNTWILKVPDEVVAWRDAKKYLVSDLASVRRWRGSLFMEFMSQDEGSDDWMNYENDGVVAAMVQARTELMSGDHRLLYLGWLMSVQEFEVAPDKPSPPIPPGLGQLSPALTTLQEFLRVDARLIEAAAEFSDPEPRFDPEALDAWIGTLPIEECREIVRGLLIDGTAPSRHALLRRFRAAGGQTAPVRRTPTPRELMRSAGIDVDHWPD
jgi:hypothetical protein